jgi:hypothetical protein
MGADLLAQGHHIRDIRFCDRLLHHGYGRQGFVIAALTC